MKKRKVKVFSLKVYFKTNTLTVKGSTNTEFIFAGQVRKGLYDVSFPDPDKYVKICKNISFSCISVAFS